jgi:uncharacterized protein YaiL (DUF2058 family)
MGNPFQDQFIKAGLVNKKQVQKANIEQRTKEKEQRKKPSAAVADNAVALALQQKKEQARQSNAQRDLAAREKEIAAQIKQLVETNRVKAGKGDIAFHFADANKIKKFYLPKTLVDQLSKGLLGIVKVEERYELVPAETAGKIGERRPEALLVLNSPKPLDPDDPYAKFPIPDDYEW